MNNPFSLRSEMGIRKRVFFLLVVVFIPLLLLQAFTFYKWYRESKEGEMQVNLELARTVSKTFDAFINDVLHTQLAIGLAATASPPPSNDSLRRILQAAEEANPILGSLTWISPAGVNLVTSNPALENQKIRALHLFPRIVSGEEYGVSDLHDSPYTGKKVFAIGRGIRDPKGTLLGIISCVCIADKLDPLLAVQRSEDTAISLLDSKGTHVYRYPAMEYTSVGMNRLKRQPIIQHALEGKEAAAEVYGPRDEIRMAAFVPIPSIRWVAASSRAKHEVIESIAQTLLPHAVFMLLVTLAAFGAAVTLSRPISTSIRRLQDHATALGQGEVKRFETVHGPREIKNLSEAFNDMAEKVRSREQALRKSEQRFRALFENSQEAVFLSSPDGSVAAANPVACTMLGCSEEEICRLGRSGVLDPDDPRLSAALEERQRTGHVQALELTAIRKSGERFPVEIDSVILAAEPHLSFVIMRDITERKRSEEALKASEKKFRDLITNMQEVLYTLDRNGRITFVSPSVLSMTQYRDSEIIGHHIEEFILRDDLPRLYQDLQNFLSGIGSSENEYRMVTKNGEIRWMRTRSSPLYEGAEIIGVQGILSDITDLKRSQEDVRAARDMQQLIMNNIPQGIFWKDRRSTYLGCNNVFAKHVGLESAGSIVGKTDYDLPWSTEQAESFREYDRRIMENDAPEYHIIEQMREADGKLSWLETNKVPLHDAQGNVIGILGTYEDITERKRAEEALKASEEKYRHLVKHAPTGIYEVDFVNKRLKSVNDVMCQVLGFTEEEFLCMDPVDLLDDDGKRTLLERIMKSLAGEKVDETVEYKIIAKDGRKLWCVLNNAFTYEEGRVTGALVVAHDVTGLKKTEEALRQSEQRYKILSTELELRVKERTAELERRNQELQNFTFAASHDLQEPLRKIQTFSDLLDTKYSDSVGTKGRDCIKRMNETATRMRAVLQSLMKYSRLTSKVEPFGRVDLNEIAREVVSDLELQIRDTGALVEIGDLPEIEADAGQMRQLFQNLLGNALKFSRDGIQPIVRIHSDCSSKNRECEICFNDNGIGFEEEYLEGIFKPFHRLHGKDKYGGVGMGLAICSKVIEHHRGTITAKSTPGKGSTFIVSLPLEQNQSDE